MFKYKLIIEYDGTNFVGWQRQDNGPSIQQSLEEAIQKLVNDEIYYGDDCYFDLTKFQITYVSPYISSRDKVDFNIFYETNYYIPLFTEYDVDIIGGSLKLYSSNIAVSEVS